MSLLVEFDNLHDHLGIILLLLTGDISLLEELLRLLGHTSELTGGRVEADMHESYGIEISGLGGRKEV